MDTQPSKPEWKGEACPEPAAELAAAVADIERGLARLDALGMTLAAAHISLGLDLAKADGASRPDGH